MLLWFVGLGLVIVWQVFRDPALDHRMIVAGVLLPDVIDGVGGTPSLPHSLIFSVGLLVLVMLITRGRRLLRRQILAIPIGTFLHLVLDGMWTDTRVFWWPFLGRWFPDRGLPSLDRPWWAIVLLEVIGAIALVWFWRRFRLDDGGRRKRFLQSGRLDPALKG